MTDQLSITVADYDVISTAYFIHEKKDAPAHAPKTMRVEYECGSKYPRKEWICLEHQGRARESAVAWWMEHSNHPVPDTVAEAVAIARNGGLCETKSISVQSISGEKFSEIVGCVLGEAPPVGGIDPQAAVEPEGTDLPFDDSDLPF